MNISILFRRRPAGWFGELSNVKFFSISHAADLENQILMLYFSP